MTRLPWPNPGGCCESYDRLNVIDFAGLFSGNAVCATSRSRFVWKHPLAPTSRTSRNIKHCDVSQVSNF